MRSEDRIKFAGRLYFGWASGKTIKQDDTQNRFDIAFGVEKSLRGFFDDLLRRVIGDETTGEFGGDKSRSGWMRDQHLDDLLRFRLTRRLDRKTQNIFLARVMQVFLEDKIAKPKMFLDIPARETTREFHHILLSVAAVHAEGVKFHQFAGIIFVGMAFLVGLIVEIDHHGGRMRRRPNQVAELTKRMFANHFAVVHCFEIEAVSLFDEDVEVVAPKLDHDLVELTLAVNLTHERGLTQFIRDGLAVIAVEELVADAFEFVGCHLQGFESDKSKVTGKVVDGFEVKLFFDPCLQTDLRKAGAFFHTRTEGEAIQREEIICAKRSPRDGGQVTCKSAIRRGAQEDSAALAVTRAESLRKSRRESVMVSGNNLWSASAELIPSLQGGFRCAVFFAQALHSRRNQMFQYHLCPCLAFGKRRHTSSRSNHPTAGRSKNRDGCRVEYGWH